MQKQRLSTEDYVRIMDKWLEAWNNADAELLASFYDDPLEYRDPTVPEGITSKEELIKYLRLVFQVWPEQRWTASTILPHAKGGTFSAEYTFRIANGSTSIEGSGMDRIEFNGEKVRLNHVYLNAERWKEWIKQELKAGKR